MELTQEDVREIVINASVDREKLNNLISKLSEYIDEHRSIHNSISNDLKEIHERINTVEDNFLKISTQLKTAFSFVAGIMALTNLIFVILSFVIK